jgi:serine/threonine-protein kinase
MKPERWQRLQELFDAAVEMNPDQRAAFLDRACADDPSLRGQVESLIISSEKAEGFIEAAIHEAAEVIAGEETPSAVGQRIGPYETVRELGHGGMGAVYLAVRADDEYRKQVAIKLVRGGLDSPEMLQRFRSERQILANLDHPHIARLLDGGTTEAGAPYVVMEYVDGEPIDEYCDRHTLSTVERLKLFRTVCSAVHYAHQNLVVHRDIKPSNILVTADGVPKLLDFGIAKLLHPEPGPHTVAVTRTAVRLMTPEYASPEQVRGEAITTATDVYSLGVVLYELLTGQRPYQFKTYSPQEIERVISEQEPEKPSTAASREGSGIRDQGPAAKKEQRTTGDGQRTAAKLRKQLAGDLDNIVLMAIRKEPSRRYASVEQLSEDIRRHLEGLPVMARPATFGYRAQKFVRRHKAGMMATAAVILLISALVGFYTVQLTQERDRARLEAEKAAQVSKFLTGLFEVSDPSQSKGETITAKELLGRGAARIENELADQPEVRATMMNVMGDVYRSLGLYEEARPLLQTSLKLRRQLHGPAHPDVAASLNNVAMVLEAQGEYEAAEQMHREALALRRKLSGDEHPDVAESLDNLAWVLYRKGDYEAAQTLYRQALDMRRKFLGPEHADVAQSLNNLAQALHAKADYPAAEALYREALALNRKLLGEEHREVATNMSNLANLLRETGHTGEAESLHHQALALRRKLLGDDHPHVTSSLNSLAVLLHEKGDWEAAEPLYREALALRRKHLGQEHPQVAVPLTGLAALMRDKGDLEAAESLYRESLALHRKTLPEGHPDIAHPLVGLAAVLSEKGEHHGAEPLLREALALRQHGLPQGHWRTAQSQSALGACLTALKHYREAEPLLQASYTALKAAFGERDKRTQRALNHLIELYQAWSQPDKAAHYRARLAKATP